jgi:hypothetical protein
MTDDELLTVHVPDDAGRWADGLERILRRIPPRWGRWMSVGPGWYPIIVALDAHLATIDPDYVVHQVKEKFGGLRYYYEPSRPACCERFAVAHPRPAHDAHDTSHWDRARQRHVESAEHKAASAEASARRHLMDEAIGRAETFAEATCDETGNLGVMMSSGRWLQTLDPATAPVNVRMLAPSRWFGKPPETAEDWASQVEYYEHQAQRWFTVARHLRTALLDQRSPEAPSANVE